MDSFFLTSTIILGVLAAQSTPYLIPPGPVPKMNQTTAAENSNPTPKYWISRSPDYTLLYVTIPIAVLILLCVLVFFLWIFSTKPEPELQFDYQRLDDEPPAGPSNSTRGSSPHPIVVDQILDMPYDNLPLTEDD